jgi:hypothetical protein
MKEEKFPKSVRITRQILGWWKDEIDAHCERLLKSAGLKRKNPRAVKPAGTRLAYVETQDETK